MIATILKAYGAKPELKDDNFVHLCHDVLGSSRWEGFADTAVQSNVDALIQKFAA